MDILVKAVLCAVVQLLIFYDLGYLVPVTKQDGKTSAAETTLVGFLIYSVVLEAEALLATWLLVPQHIFFCIWGVTLSIGIVTSLVWNFGKWRHRVAVFFRNFRFESGMLLFPVVALGAVAECAFAATRLSGSAGVIAQMATDLRTNSLSVFSGATGEAVTSIAARTLLARWLVNGEFWSSLLAIPAATYAHVTGSILTVVLSAMTIYRLGWRLFDGKKRYACWMSLLVMLCNVFFTTNYTASGILLQTAFSGDAMLANVILPLCLLLALIIYEEAEWKHLFFPVFCAGVAGFCVSEWAFWMIPVICLFGMLPAILAGKKWSGIIWTALVTAALSALSLFVVLIPEIPFGR